MVQTLATRGKFPVASIHVSSTFLESAISLTCPYPQLYDPSSLLQPPLRLPELASFRRRFTEAVYLAKRQPLIPSYQGGSCSSKISCSQTPWLLIAAPDISVHCMTFQGRYNILFQTSLSLSMWEKNCQSSAQTSLKFIRASSKIKEGATIPLV